MSLGLFVLDFLIGAISMSVSKIGTAPFQRAKLLLQNQADIVGIPANKKYTGVWDVLIRLPQEQGIFSYWRGTLCELIRYYPTQALNFALKDSIKNFLRSTFGPSSPQYPGKQFLMNILSGSIAGAISLAFVYPLDFVNTRLALDIGTTDATREFSGIFDCAYKAISSDGVTGLYAGFFISVFGVISYRAVYFGLFDSLNYQFTASKQSPAIKFLFSMVITIMAGLATYPTDTLRRRLMLAVGNSNSHCTGSVSCVSHILKEDGINGFFEGALGNIIRSVVSSLILVIWDIIVPLLKSLLANAFNITERSAHHHNHPARSHMKQGPTSEQLIAMLQDLDKKNREFLETNLSPEQMKELTTRREAIKSMVDSISNKPTEAEIAKITGAEQDFEVFLKGCLTEEKFEQMNNLQMQFEQVYMQLQMGDNGGHNHGGGCCGGDHSHDHSQNESAAQSMEDKKNS
jgi:solute carrier family 25 (mitochondrial adenine nucleotide translocator), member 4/5/6/31